MKEPLRVLILEDVAYDAELIVHELKKAHMDVISKTVVSKSQYIQELKDFKPEVILVDHTLPQFNSVEALKIFLEHKLHIPFILVTGTVSEEFAVSILHQGADDYILKQSLTRLPSAIDMALKKKKAELEREQALEILKIKNIELTDINNELDHLVYSASHDLRSPISSILGLLNLINTEKDLQTIRTYVTLLEKTVYKLDKTIRDIIEYSFNRRKEIEVEELDIRALLLESFQKLKFLYLKTPPEFIIETSGNFPFYSDKERVKIIFCHLLSNSIIYGNIEKPVVMVNVNVTVKEAVFSFQDNGEGVHPDQTEKIFEMFYKGSLRSRGAGLGLYIVKEALRKLHGNIHVATSNGSGANFIVQIPNQ